MLFSFSVASVWFKCSDCDCVWRSSLLQTILGSRVGAVGVWRPEKEQTASAATATAPEALTPACSSDMETSMDLGDLDRLDAEIDGLLDVLDAGAAPNRA